MAQTTLTLSAHFTPAYYALLNTAEVIKARHGEDTAMAWALKTLQADFGLFCTLSADRRPELRLIIGGRGD
jgi:hypothetical protein